MWLVNMVHIVRVCVIFYLFMPFYFYLARIRVTIRAIFKGRILARISILHKISRFWLFVLEIDRYIGLPIFFPIFKHFTIIGYRFCKKKNIGFDFFFFFFFIHT